VGAHVLKQRVVRQEVVWTLLEILQCEDTPPHYNFALDLFFDGHLPSDLHHQIFGKLLHGVGILTRGDLIRR
jgi:hypothetical protein